MGHQNKSRKPVVDHWPQRLGADVEGFETKEFAKSGYVELGLPVEMSAGYP